MRDINDLRRERAALADQLAAQADAVEAAEAEGGDALDQAVAAFDDVQAQFDKADAAVQRAERVEAAKVRAATSPREDMAGGSGRSPARAQRVADKGLAFGLIGAAVMQAGKRPDAVAEWLDGQSFGQLADQVREDHAGRGMAAMHTATDAAGGFAVPQPVAEEIIPELQARNAVRAAGARTVPMPAGELRNSGIATGATSSYVGDNAVTSTSTVTLRAVDQTFKKLTTQVPVSNSLLRYGVVALATAIRDNMIGSMAQTEGLQMLRADGTSNRVKGLRHWAAAGNVQSATALASAEAAINRAVSDVEGANVAMARPAWIMRADVLHGLSALRASGEKVFPSIDVDRTLKGHPIFVANQLPTDLGAGADSEVFFADFAEVVIGDAMALRISAVDGGAYHDGSAVVSGLSRDETVFTAISEHDLAAMHDEAIAVINATSWG